MFNLEEGIARWKKRLAEGGIEDPELLAELESHLREDLKQRLRSEVCDLEAFAAATRQIGEPDVLNTEFTKARSTVGKKLKRLFLNFLAIHNPQFTTTMNTQHPNSNVEPGWATYFKASAFVMPAALLWLLCTVFLMPKLRQVCEQAGTSFFTLNGAPAIFRPFAFVGQGMMFLTQHSLLIIGTMVPILTLLEWRFNQWPRYRKAALGVGAFILNLAVLVSITLLVVTAIVAAANLHNLK